VGSPPHPNSSSETYFLNDTVLCYSVETHWLCIHQVLRAYLFFIILQGRFDIVFYDDCDRRRESVCTLYQNIPWRRFQHQWGGLLPGRTKMTLSRKFCGALRTLPRGWRDTRQEVLSLFLYSKLIQAWTLIYDTIIVYKIKQYNCKLVNHT
jgi:hypothetical protein